jgi:branched-chain amino acid transport system substrate-binding protein
MQGDTGCPAQPESGDHSMPHSSDPDGRGAFLHGPLRRRIAAALLVASCTTSSLAGPPEPLRIGLIAPLTGLSADFGNSVLDGARLAVAEVNAMGGMMGRPLELAIKDDRGDPATGRDGAKALASDPRVGAAIGFCNTGVALNSIDVFERAKKVLIVPCAQGNLITRQMPSQESVVFRVAPSDEISARFLVDEIASRRRLTRVAVLADTTAYGDNGVVDIGRELRKHGLGPVCVTRFAPDVQSLQAELASARAAGGDALVVYTVGPGQAVAARARAALRWNVPYFAPWTLAFHSVLDKAGPAALEGTMMTQTIIRDAANVARMSFLSGYGRQTQHTPIGSLMAAAQAYDSVQLLVRALLATHGSTQGPDLKKALESPSEAYHGVVTVYDHPFSADDHEAFSMNMLWLGVWRDGEVRYQRPEDARLSAVVRRKQAH